MAARNNDKATSEKAMAMIRSKKALSEVARACGFTPATAQYYKRKVNGLKGDALYGRARRHANGAHSAGDADLARRVNANCRRWEKIVRLMREME